MPEASHLNSASFIRESKKMYDPQQTENPSENRVRVLEGSYLILSGKPVDLNISTVSAKVITDKLTLFYPDSGSLKNWHELESEQYQLLLDGFFYTDVSNSYSGHSNLKAFLDRLEKKGLEVAESEISGGMFNLFVIDKQSGKLVILNDRLGLLPLYFIPDEEKCFFSNNQFNLQSQTVVNQAAIYEFLKYGYLPAAPSLFKDVQRLAASESIELQAGTTEPKLIPRDLPAYPPRRTEDVDFLNKWADFFIRFFKRIQSRKIMLGLSGGYNTRLLAAYLNHRDPTILNFAVALTPENKLAKNVAKSLTVLLANDQFPADTVSQYADRLALEFRTVASLEHAHLMHLSSRVKGIAPELYLDGFLGAEILGDAYYEEAPTGFNGILGYLFPQNDKYFTKPASTAEYVDELFHEDAQALSDSELLPYLGQTYIDEVRSGFESLVDRWTRGCTRDSDLKERLKIMTEARNLMAVCPIAMNTYCQVLLPFTDYRIFDLSQETPKSQRFAHGLYNRLFKQFHPDLVDIRRAGSFGSPSDSAFMYRLKTVFANMLKKDLFTSARKANPRTDQRMEQYFSPVAIIKTQQDHDLFDNQIKKGHPRMPRELHRKFSVDYLSGKIDPRLLLRYVSLLLYLRSGD